MKILEDILYIDSQIDNTQIELLKEEILESDVVFSKVMIEENGSLASSALIAFLVSLKKTYPTVEIPFLQNGSFDSYESVVFIAKG